MPMFQVSNAKPIGQLLAHLRQAAGLTPGKMEKGGGPHHWATHLIESGNYQSGLNVLKQYLKALGYDGTLVLTRSEQPTGEILAVVAEDESEPDELLEAAEYALAWIEEALKDTPTYHSPVAEKLRRAIESTRGK